MILVTRSRRAGLSPAQPQFINSDGDGVLFHDLRYPLASGVKQKAVAERLNRVKGFLPDGPKFWNWLAAQKGRGGKAGGGGMLDTQMEGATVLGSVELKGRTLLVTVNSAERVAKVQALIDAAAGDLLKSPLTTIRTVDQMRADQRRDGPSEETDEIPPEIARQLMRDHLDKHYRETLDAPIPALGGKSPRQAVRTAAGREKVIEWLKMLENCSAGHPDIPVLPREPEDEGLRLRAVDQRALLHLDSQLAFLGRVNRQRCAGLDIRRRVTRAAGKPITTK